MSGRRARARLSMAVGVTLLFAVLIVGAGKAASERAPDGTPGRQPAQNVRPQGMPVVIRTAVKFVHVASVDENAGAFVATIDLRLRWVDRTLRGKGRVEARGDEAVAAALQTVWHPEVVLANLDGEPADRERGVTIETDGTVEVLERTKGTFKTPIRVTNFPFDRHPLGIEVLVRGAALDDVVLDFLQEDIAFSGAGSQLEIDGWHPRLVDLTRAPVAGWHGQFHSRVVAQLWVERDSNSVFAPVFIPLFSALLIPLLAIWLQKTEDGAFAIDAFELANILIGGLFAVIALNFTINAEFRTIASGDNTVTRLFGLTYTTLAASLLVVIALFRFNLAGRLFGRWVQEQVFRVLLWAIPVLSLGTGIAFLAAAACG